MAQFGYLGILQTTMEETQSSIIVFRSLKVFIYTLSDDLVKMFCR